jgi:hypothetical protein
VPTNYPVVFTLAQEMVKNGFVAAGRPDAYDPNSVRYVTTEQFAYVAAVNGIMLRDKPAANIYLGAFFAESLLLAETGFATKAIQVAGTAQVAQLPFFVVACDYTLIGEELYAAARTCRRSRACSVAQGLRPDEGGADPHHRGRLRARDRRLQGFHQLHGHPVGIMSFFKQHLPVWLTAIIGVLTILSFFMPHPLIADPAETLQNWAIVIVASGYVLGAANVLKVNGEDVAKQRTNWPYKIVLLASMLGMMIVGFFLSGGTHFLDAGTKFSWAYDNLYVPMQATMFALLAFFIASAAFRAFRIRTIDAGLLAIAALIVMIGRVPIGSG